MGQFQVDISTLLNYYPTALLNECNLIVFSETSMIIMTLRFTVPPEKIADVIGIINSIKEPICVEPRCNHSSLYNDNALMLVGEWESQEVLGHGG